MADTSTFMAIGQVPQVDYGAVYRNAKARRELEEERKLAYLNQFQQERGSFTSGLQDQLQMEWDAIEADLDQGDMSFEAKARRQKMYNTYKQHAADALTYAETINNLEASILADPTLYNDPAAIMKQLEQARSMSMDLNGIASATSQLPQLNEFRRYSLPEISPNAAAGMILENLKTSGGYNDFYDMTGDGALSPEAVAASVSAWFGANSMSQEEEDQAIAYVLHQLGGLSGSMEDLSKIRNLDDAKREEYIGMYAQYVTKSLTNMLAQDIETQKEQDQRDLDLYETKLRIKAREDAAAQAANPADIFSVVAGDVSYAPPIAANDKGDVIKISDPELVNAGFQIHANIDGTQPSYRDERGVLHYIESIGIDSNGQQIAVVRSSQSVKNRKNKTESHIAREAIPISEIPLTGLSNAAQAKKIQNTFDQMLPYWSQNFAGKQQPAGQFDADIDALAGLEPEPGVPVNMPPAPVRSFMEDNPPPPEAKFDIDASDWGKMSFNEKSNYILDAAKAEYSDMVVSNPKTGYQTEEWNTLTPNQRQAVQERIRKELQRHLGGSFDRAYNLK